VEQDGLGGWKDTVRATLSWTLAPNVEVLVLEEAPEAIRGTGNAGYNWIYGNSLNNLLVGGGGQDDLYGGAGDDTLNATGGSSYGEDGNDLIIDSASGWLTGGNGDDRLEGGSRVFGDDGNDTIVSGAGNAEIVGGLGADTFIFQQAPLADGSNWDRYDDFASGSDMLRFDGRVFTQLGASGAFAVGDERFYSGYGVRAAHDSSDRLIYDTAAGDLFYDPDGIGAAAAVKVATLGYWYWNYATPTLRATDIAVDNGAPTPMPGGQLSAIWRFTLGSVSSALGAIASDANDQSVDETSTGAAYYGEDGAGSADGASPVPAADSWVI
jgi:Ca2+-binding RTX toxin-like protein